MVNERLHDSESCHVRVKCFSGYPFRTKQVDTESFNGELEEAYTLGNFNIVEKVLETRIDIGVDVPCVLLYNATRIGRYRTVRLLLENYSHVCCDEITLTNALRYALVFHDVRQLCDWNDIHFEGHIREVTLRCGNEDIPPFRDCPCERAKIIHELIIKGASTTNIATLLETFLQSSPIVCKTSFTNTLDVIIEHGCNLAKIASKYTPCRNLYDLGRNMLFTIISRIQTPDSTLPFTVAENILSILIERADSSGSLRELHDFGCAISKNHCQTVVKSHQTGEKDAVPRNILEHHGNPCSLQSICRRRIRDVLHDKQTECREHKPKTITTLIKTLHYPQILKRYLSFDSYNWRRKDLL